ncbi:MAG: lysophospholipid acyltransferase family protein [Thiogranum sp.]|nr:lysophospholipid acyltransferase family protein [Thiogranum sp.]
MARILFRESAERVPLLGNLGWWLEARMLALFWYWVTRTDVERASRRGYRLFHWLGPRLRKNHHVLSNLQVAFADMSAQRRLTLAKQVWGNFGAVLAEYPFLPELVRMGPGSRTDISVSEASSRIIRNRQPAVYVTAHSGNWEIGTFIMTSLKIPVTTVYSPQSNPFVDRMLQSFRETPGLKFIPAKNAMRQLVRELREGRSVGMLPDQRNDGGDPVPYFGVKAPTITSPAWLAVTMNCPLIPVEVERIGEARFRAVFHDPVDSFAEITDKKQRVLAITGELNTCFESWIRKHPQHWHCTKRRWPSGVPSGVSFS